MNNRNLARGQTTATLNNIIKGHQMPLYHSMEQFLRLKVDCDP